MRWATTVLVRSVGIISGGGLLLLLFHLALHLLGIGEPSTLNWPFIDGFLWAAFGSIVGDWMVDYFNSSLGPKDERPVR